MWENIVLRHITPTSKGSLTVEIQQLSKQSGISIKELGEFLKDHLSDSAMLVITREIGAGILK